MNDEKRTVDEAYTSAVASTNLRVEADRTGDADVIIAAGWSTSRIGGALRRLHAEWDMRHKPRLFTAEQILPGLKTGTMKERKVAAQAMAHAQNQKLMAGVFDRLPSLPVVRQQLQRQLSQWRVEDPDLKSAAILRWRLSPLCPVCNGTKYQVVEGTNRQNGKPCRPCGGTGHRPIPFDQEGRRAATWLDQCAARAESLLEWRLGKH